MCYWVSHHFQLARHSFVPTLHRFAGPKSVVEQVCGPEVAAKLKPIWDVDEEGEIRGVWRDVGIPNMWNMMGMFEISIVNVLWLTNES